ncbi:MAG: hypothetical protein JO121_26775 [Deltaproteobacteria bacterium]|nr:hypothetical protein [Deltaproteobacteria bacterium]
MIEIRALHCGLRGVTVAGYFDSNHLAEAADLVMKREAAGIYLTLNPVRTSLLARAANRFVERPNSTTTDSDIDRRTWLFIDFDPRRPSGISATEEEKHHALQRAEECRQIFADTGWVEPLVCDSGNGVHLNYPIDLPNDSASRVLLNAC